MSDSTASLPSANPGLPLRSDAKTPSASDSPRGRRRWPWIVALAIGAAITICLIVASVATSRVEPYMKEQIVAEISRRFQSQVQLDSFHVSVIRGFEVQGDGLSMRSPEDSSLPPIIAVQHFRFHVGWDTVLKHQAHITLLKIEGMSIHLPPKGSGTQLPHSDKKSQIAFTVDEIDCQDTDLVLRASKPGKVPLNFAIHSLKLISLTEGQPLHFDALLENPKPIGEIHSTGNFGPWNSDDPGISPVNGDYSFSHADLSTIKGIAGILSSKGRYQGPLNTITVDGYTDTPDFSISTSGQKVNLHTDFHAIVNGMNGDTYLQPVKAHFLNSYITAVGDVVRVPDHGHDITLDLHIDKARIEDLLRLAVRTNPPLMTGDVQMTTQLRLPPSKQPIPERLNLKGIFGIAGVRFTNPETQDKVDSLSLRSQGKAREAKQSSPQDVQSEMRGNFTLNEGVLNLDPVEFAAPGLTIQMNGQYSLTGEKFEFTGKARTDAKVSHMVTGWKSMLLKPVDPFFHKDGAGAEIPIKVSGTRNAPKFGLDLRDKNNDKHIDQLPNQPNEQPPAKK